MTQTIQNFHAPSGRRFVPPYTSVLTALLLAAQLAAVFAGNEASAAEVDAAALARSVTIHRDRYGVPHIDGPTDESVIFAFAFPFTANVVTEFRPDCAVGIVAALGVILLMRRSPASSGGKDALWTGSILAVALLIKPTFAPFTVVTFTAAWLISAFFVHVTEVEVRLQPGHVLRQLGWFALPSLIIALPYYLIHFQVVTYIQNQAFGRNKTAFAGAYWR